MTLKKLLAGGLAGSALTVFALAGCGQSESTDKSAGSATKQTGQNKAVDRTQTTKAEVGADARKIAEDSLEEGAANGDPNLRLILAMKDHHPEIYNDFVNAIGALIEDGNFDEDDAYEAGATVRPKMMAAFGKAMITASDENLVRLIDHSSNVYRQMLKVDPQECVRNINGLPPSDPDIISNQLQARETDIMIDIFEDGPVKGVETVNQPDLMAWMVPLLKAHPDHLEAFGLTTTDTLTDAQATDFCQATIFIMDEMLKQDEARAAALFRGMAQLNG